MGYVIVLVVLFALMWLLLIRPQRKRQLEQSQMQDTIAAGDEVLTAGGIHGTVREVEDDVVRLEIAPGTTVRLDRRAVAAILTEAEVEGEEEIEAPPESTVTSDES